MNSTTNINRPNQSQQQNVRIPLLKSESKNSNNIKPTTRTISGSVSKPEPKLTSHLDENKQTQVELEIPKAIKISPTQVCLFVSVCCVFIHSCLFVFFF